MKRFALFLGLAVLALVGAAQHFAPGLLEHSAAYASLQHLIGVPGLSGLGAMGFAPMFGTTSSANTPRTYELGDYAHLPVADNVKIYEGSAIGDNGSGYARALTAADPFRGFCVEFADNTISGHAAGGIYVQYKRWGLIQLSVTGVTAVTDVGKPVYASDDMTFTTTSTSNSYIGRIVRWISSTNCVVEFDGGRAGFSKETSLTDNSAGTSAPTTGVSANAQKDTTIVIPIGALTGLANSQTWKVAVPFAFTVTAALIRAGAPVTTGSKLATLTVQINGTPVTGGVISATSAGLGTTGATQAATSITAANTGTAGQTLEVAVSAVTAFVEGTAYVELTVTNTDKANQAATLAAAINAFNTQVSS